MCASFRNQGIKYQILLLPPNLLLELPSPFQDLERVRKAPKGGQEEELSLYDLVLESLNHQKTHCVEEDEFLDTHMDHVILKG